MTNFFNETVAIHYDQNNQRLAPIADNMHFLIRLILNELPSQARILCVGVGTGAEIISLAQAYPEWTFTGVDPSQEMLTVCRERLTALGIAERVELIHGYVADVPTDRPYDVVLSILVGHFVSRNERPDFYRHMQEHLRPDGYFITTEVSYDTDSDTFPSMLAQWAKVQQQRTATAETIAALTQTLTNVLTVLPPSDVETLLTAAGFSTPVQFFQSFMIAGWYARKA